MLIGTKFKGWELIHANRNPPIYTFKCLSQNATTGICYSFSISILIGIYFVIQLSRLIVIQLSRLIRYYKLQGEGLTFHLSRMYDLSNLDETIMSADVTISLTISAALCPLFSSLSP
jgi:hypothetical protein